MSTWLDLPAWSWFTIGVAVVVVLVCRLIVYVRRSDDEFLRARAAKKATAVAVATSQKPQISRKPLIETISFKEVSAAYHRRKTLLDESLRRVDGRLNELRTRHFETFEPERVLSKATQQELASFTPILKTPPGASPAQVVTEIRQAGSNIVGVMVKGYVPYREVLSDVAQKLGAKKPDVTATDAAVEQEAIVAAFNRMLDKAKPEDRKALEAQLFNEQQKLARGVGATAGTLVLAHLSGFGLYVAASSVLGAVTGALGLTLPFAVYTGMSTVIATITGPIGWAALAVVTVLGLGRANFKKTIPAVIAVATIRARLIAERDQETAVLTAERDGDLARQADVVATLAGIVDRMKRDRLDAIPKADVPVH